MFLYKSHVYDCILFLILILSLTSTSCVSGTTATMWFLKRRKSPNKFVSPLDVVMAGNSGLGTTDLTMISIMRKKMGNSNSWNG